MLVLDDNTSITGGTLTIGASSEVEIKSGGNGSATLDGVDVVNSGGLLQIDFRRYARHPRRGDAARRRHRHDGERQFIAEPFTDTGSVVTLDNIDNTISGAGTIGRHDDLLAITNSGTIDANAPSGAILSIDTADDRGNSSTLADTGTLEATNNGELSVHATVNDASGTVETLGGFVDFELGITGGSATISNGGKLEYGWSGIRHQLQRLDAGTLVLDDQNRIGPEFQHSVLYDRRDDVRYRV